MIHKKRWGGAFRTTILILIIACHELWYVELILWLLLGFACLNYPKLAVEAIFFFGSFFVGAGFFQNPLVTVKHFHIGLAILLLVSMVRWKGERWKVRENWHSIRVLTFWIVLVALSAFSLWRVGDGLVQGLRTNGNLFLTVICAALLSISITPEEAMGGLGFLTLGVFVRGVSGALAYVHVPGPYLKEIVLYNNHLGFFTATALLCLLPLIVTSKDFLIRLYSVIAFAFLFFVLMITCSRTSYVSFFGGLITFMMLQGWLRKRGFAASDRWSIWLLFLSVCLGGTVIILVSSFLFPMVGPRVWMTLNLLVPSHWQRALLDKQNFGFLGHFRLDQFQVLGEIMKQHLILGIGLVRQVTDFHSLYLTLLGGTGLVGLFIFLAFCFSWVRRLFRAMVMNDGIANMFRVSLVSCMVSWLLTSFAESFFLQFNIWVIIAAGIALSKSVTFAKG